MAWTASINDHIRCVRGLSLEHANNILISLESVGLDVHAKRESFPLPHINVDALPLLDASERETLKYVATGKLLGFPRLCAAKSATTTDSA